jgi:hypothetical protein
MIDLAKEVIKDKISTDYKKVLDLLEKKNQLWSILWEEKYFKIN